MIAKQLSVIVVDKHPMMRTALSAALASAERVNVLAEYASIREFFNAREHLSPNMILLGISNPGSDELAMVHALRRIYPSAKILVLVSGELEGQVQVALGYGAHYVLEKTVSREELLGTLRRSVLRSNFI